MDARVTVPGVRGPFTTSITSPLKAGDTFEIPGRPGTLRVTAIELDPREDEFEVVILTEVVEPDAE